MNRYYYVVFSAAVVAVSLGIYGYVFGGAALDKVNAVTKTLSGEALAEAAKAKEGELQDAYLEGLRRATMSSEELFSPQVSPDYEALVTDRLAEVDSEVSEWVFGDWKVWVRPQDGGERILAWAAFGDHLRPGDEIQLKRLDARTDAGIVPVYWAFKLAADEPAVAAAGGLETSLPVPAGTMMAAAAGQ